LREAEPVSDPPTPARLDRAGARGWHIEGHQWSLALEMAGDGRDETESCRRAMDFHLDACAFPTISNRGTSSARRGRARWSMGSDDGLIPYGN
jgi:hypothetical protein